MFLPRIFPIFPVAQDKSSLISTGKSGMVSFIQLFADKIGALLGKMHQ